MFRILLNQNLSSCRKTLRGLLNCSIRNSSAKCPDACLQPSKNVASEPPKIKVAICGANGQVGSIIAFLLKLSPLVDVVSLYDLDCTYGMAMDLAHIDTKCRVQSFSGFEDLHECLEGSQIIVICAGVGRAPGMTRDDLFEYNAPVVKQIAETITKASPESLVAILTNPINSLVPMVSEIFRNAKCYDPRKIFGITTIDTMRAASIMANDVLKKTEDPSGVLLPVIGGHSKNTMVPILSQACPCVDLSKDEMESVVKQIRCAACLVTSLKGRGGPRLSAAMAASRFITNLIRGLRDEKEIVDLAYVRTTAVPGVTYFSSPIELGPSGIRTDLGLLKVSEECEKLYLKEAINYLKCDIKKGESYIPKPLKTASNSPC